MKPLNHARQHGPGRRPVPAPSRRQAAETPCRSSGPRRTAAPAHSGGEPVPSTR
jgi:hypothetical protein